MRPAEDALRAGQRRPGRGGGGGARPAAPRPAYPQPGRGLRKGRRPPVTVDPLPGARASPPSPAGSLTATPGTSSPARRCAPPCARAADIQRAGDGALPPHRQRGPDPGQQPPQRDGHPPHRGLVPPGGALLRQERGAGLAHRGGHRAGLRADLRPPRGGRPAGHPGVPRLPRRRAGAGDLPRGTPLARCGPPPRPTRRRPPRGAIRRPGVAGGGHRVGPASSRTSGLG